MPKRRNPRRGSMQYWPRKRSAKIVASIKNWPKIKDAKPLGFAGYKIGMTHILYTDARPVSPTKGMEISVPVTIIECPPIKVAGINLYTTENHCLKLSTTVLFDKLDKELSRKMPLPKIITAKIEDVKPEALTDVRLLVYTQPKMTGIGKKMPEVFEMGIGGSTSEKLNYAKNILGKEISVKDVFSEGQLMDIHAVSKGHGYQGPVKRFGVMILSHKSQKTKRGPANVGGWTCNRSWPVPHAGQTGFHQRIEYNKMLFKIIDDVTKLNPKSGFVRYGIARNSCMLVKGSVIGASKRLITFTQPMRINKSIAKEVPQITSIGTQ